jgi:O-antigen/teichoic acid export membrane protein
MDSETTRAMRRGAWTVAGCHVVSQLFSLALLSALYRLVSPEEFGIFAIVLVIINFARIFSTWGLGVASLQDQDLTDEEQSALFYFGIRRAIIVCSIVFFSVMLPGFASSDFWLIVVLSLPLFGLATSTCGLQHQARLERKLLLGRLAVCRLGAQVLGGGVALLLAWQGAGVWALCAQFLSEAAGLVLLLWTVEPWRPSRLNKQSVDIERFKVFGFRYTASSLMFWITQNADTLLIGMLGGRVAVGLYSQAFNMMNKPVLLVTTPLSSVMLPTLAQAAENRATYARLLHGYFRIIGQMLFPCSVGMLLVAEDLMLVFGGETWRPAGTLLQALSPMIAVQGFINVAGSVFASVGQAGRLLYCSTVIALVLLVAFAIGWQMGGQFLSPPLDGPLGVSICYSFATVLVIFLPYLWFCVHTVKVRLLTILRELRKPLLASMAMGAIVAAVQYYLVSPSPAVRLAVAVSIGIFSYALIMLPDLKRTLRPNSDVYLGH